jgi:probable phosphomutase (TIGR03848 family)
MTTFFLVRHAATSHTNHRLSGWMPGIHLTEEGRAQAEATADGLATVPLKAVYASPIARTTETARPIAERHRLEVLTRRDIGEVEYGKWTNRSLKVLARTKMWATVQRWPGGVRFPEGESLRGVQSRAVDGMEALRVEHPKHSVCVVSHGDVIKLVAAHYLGLHIDLFQRIVIVPASITVVSVSDDGPRVLALNVVPNWGSGASAGVAARSSPGKR